MSPEVLEGATEFTSFAFQQIDVYAAALVIWEVLSRTCINEENKEENVVNKLTENCENIRCKLCYLENPQIFIRKSCPQFFIHNFLSANLVRKFLSANFYRKKF